MAMDWDGAIERYGEALRRIVAMMVAMASAAAGAGALTSPLWGGRAEGAGGGGGVAMTPTRPSDDGRTAGDPDCSAIAPAFSADDRAAGSIEGSASKPHKREVETARPTLPRHLYRAVLNILRPAESAARRLIVVAAREVVVPAPRLAEPKPPKRKPSPTGIVYPYGMRPGMRLGGRFSATHPTTPAANPTAHPTTRAVPARISLPLCDTLRPPSHRPRRVPAREAPRISVPGLTALHRLPPKPTPFDPVDATRVTLRIAALASVLDDLPRQALRFARWRARRDAMLAERAAESAGQNPAPGPDRNPRRGSDRRPAVPRPRRYIRLSTLRPGRPPGSRRRDRREVHEVLADLQQLAWWVLESPDTS